MSHRIEYDFRAWRIPAADAGMQDDQYLVVVLGGDNNVYSQCGARSRKWSAMCLGSYKDVIRRACYFATSCEGGMLKMYGRRDIAPEAYVAKIRKLIDAAPPLDYCGSDGCFSLNFKLEGTKEAMAALAASHKDVHDALYQHAEPTEEKRWYESVERLRWKFTRAGNDLRLFFRLPPAFMQSDSAAWTVVEVSGPGEK